MKESETTLKRQNGVAARAQINDKGGQWFSKMEVQKSSTDGEGHCKAETSLLEVRSMSENDGERLIGIGKMKGHGDSD